MAYDISLKELAPQPVLVARRRVSQPEIGATIGEVVPLLFQFAKNEGVVLTGKPLTRYIDVGPDLMTIEPGMRIVLPEGEFAGEATNDDSGSVRQDTLPGGLVASTIHAGSYDTLGDAYAALEAWIESEGLAPAGAPWESYVTDPTEHPDPKDWKTEIFWPVQKA